jgi:type VI secretion system protein ImpM
MEQADSRTGFYGKLASHGDFVSRRLSPVFVREWDAWLQAGLRRSREGLGEHWQAAYLCSPIWHFALAADVCAEPGWAGVLMPSVDRVGRYFPLTVAYGGQDAPVLQRLRCDGDWYAEVERLALSSLETGFALEPFDAALSGLRVPSRGKPVLSPVDPGVAAVGTVWLTLEDHLPMAQAIEQWSLQLARRVGGQSLAGHSLFWTDGSAHLPPTLLLCLGLPTAQQFVEMLAGRGAGSSQNL